MAHPASACAAEQGRDQEVLAASPGLGLGRYLLDVKGSSPATSPTCTGCCVRPSCHRQCLGDSSLRQSWTRGDDALAEAKAGRDEAAAGLW